MDAHPTETPALRNIGGPWYPLSPDGEPASVLLVDDNPGKLKSLCAVVAGLGLNMVAVASGRDALRQLLRRDFAVVVLDVNMPGMDGYETATLIHSRPRSAHTPIIFVTAEAMTEADSFRGYTLGAVDYIYSPIVPEILRAKIGVFVGLYYLNRQLKHQADELKQRAEEIERNNLQLAEASRMKSEFLANMSHELRTPLNAIIGFSELLKDGHKGELSKSQQNFITEIFNSGVHLLALINDILDLSKVEAGAQTLVLETIDVAALLQSCLGVVKEKAELHRIAMKLDLPEGLAPFVADARKLKQIVYNLLSNAVKFTLDGGEVSLSACPVERADIYLKPAPGAAIRQLPLPESEFEDFLEIRVCDTGIGIAQKDLPSLFRIFVQLGSSFTRSYEGTGLGLALVQRLVELHGGTAAVESLLGHGSCFVVWLPWRGEEALAPPVEKATAQPDADAPRRRALVIEDESGAAETLRGHLEEAGFRVSCAAGALEGLEMALRERPDLITLDLLLPGMSGWETLSRIKTTAELSAIPVVIVSTRADKEIGFALGAAKVLQKPVPRQALLEAVHALGLDRPPDRPFTVLVVDDDYRAVELTVAHLEGQDCQIVRAYSGREAIAIAQTTALDLIILDLLMPDVSGFDVVDALKSERDTAAVPILIVTSKTVTQQDRERLSKNVLQIMAKGSLDQQQFLAEIRRALPGN